MFSSYVIKFSFYSPTTIFIENDDSESTLSRRNTDLVLAGYSRRNSSHRTMNSSRRSSKQNTNSSTDAVPSIVNQIVINNIEEEDDENIDQDSDNVAAKQLEYHPQVVVTSPRQINKTMSEHSNIGKYCKGLYERD